MATTGKALTLVLVALVVAQSACSNDEPPEARRELGAADASVAPLSTVQPEQAGITPERPVQASRAVPLRGFEERLTVPGIADWLNRQPFEPREHRTPLIVNGMKADPGQFPWMALLTRKEDPDVVCSGALIEDTWVLTAEHCLKIINPGDLVHFWTGPPIPVKDTFPHGSGHDVALIELESAAPHTPIAIGPAPAIGTGVTLIGFGEDENGTKGELNYALASLVEANLCSGIEMTTTMLCAGDDASVVCFGDSGGPLLDGERLIGVANEIDPTILCGPAPAGTLRVGAFARADAYVTWIDGVTAGT